jgi:hypothetical protein
MDGINQTTMRDAHGRFVRGNSGNPAGKKPGTRNRATVLREALRDGEDIAAARIVIDKALAGDAVAARFIVDRLTPRPRGRTIALDLPEATKAGDVLASSNATIAAMAAGEITPDEALTVTKVLDSRLRALKAVAREEKKRDAARSKPPSCPPTMRSRCKAASRMAPGSGRGEVTARVERPTPSEYTPRPELVEGHGSGNAVAALPVADFRASLLHSACNLQFAAAPPFLTTGSRAA